MDKNSCCCDAGGKSANDAGCGTENINRADDEQSCGCGAAQKSADIDGKSFCGKSKSLSGKRMTGVLHTAARDVPQVSTKLEFADTCGAWKARWGMNRMHYTVNPGLYCVGRPNGHSPVLVTANYKMTFDRLRRELGGLSVWILVLDTKGINVWCAAGKGTFGTEELVHRIESVDLKNVVSHRTLILPQLGATGVAAFEVKKQSGFAVKYGPVYAKDIKAYIASGMKATKEMREVRFSLMDRLVLTPIELVAWLKPSIIIFGILFILNAIGFGHYGIVELYAYLGAVFAGAVLAPVLLPWIPGRAFAWKGFLLGLIWAVGVEFINGWPGSPAYGWLKAVACLLILPVVSAYGAMNFTGASTYTSPSGVNKEMKKALPVMVIAAGLGIILLIVNDIVLLVG